MVHIIGHMENRKTVTFTQRQLNLLVKEAKELTVSFAELVRRIIDKHYGV